MQWTVPASAATGIQIRPVLQAADGILIAENRISAMGLLAAIYLGASPETFKAVSIIGNMARGTTTSLQCANPTLFEEPIVHASNNWTTAPACTVPLVPQRP